MFRHLRKHLFLGLHWKGFLWVSILLIGLSSAFYILNHYYLISQFRSQRQTEVQYLKRQVGVLLHRSTERLVRLSGALASIFETDETRNHYSPETTEFNPANANYAKLGFELDIHEIGFFTADSDLIWSWSQSENFGSIATENWLHHKIREVAQEEKPTSLLVCTPNCLLYAFVPILDYGHKRGVMTISQSIADFIIEFNAVTNTDFVLTMPVQPDIQQDILHQWSTRIAGITNADRVTPLLQNLTERFHSPQVFENGPIVKWNTNSYDIHYIPLASFLDEKEGAIFLFPM